jgi:hypothetical protein
MYNKGNKRVTLPTAEMLMARNGETGGQMTSIKTSRPPCVDTERTPVDVESLMTRLARAGVTTLVKADDERMAEEGETWTVILSGAVLGEQGGIRAESADLRSGLEDVLERLAARPGNWAWLEEFRV